MEMLKKFIALLWPPENPIKKRSYSNSDEYVVSKRLRLEESQESDDEPKVLVKRIFVSYFEQNNEDKNLGDTTQLQSFLSEAKRLKHVADNESDLLAQAMLYLDAVLYFMLTSGAMESAYHQNAFLMYKDTLMLVKFISSKYRRHQQYETLQANLHSKVAILCLRCQSFICMKLYKMRRYEVKKVQENYQGQYLITYLLNCHDLWEQADLQITKNNHTDFFIALDHENGPITLHSSILNVVKYVQAGIQMLRHSVEVYCFADTA